MKYYYEDIEIEISSETQDHAFAGVAKFRPAVNNVSTLLVCGGFFTREEAEEKVLEQAKVLINRSKGNAVLKHCAAPALGPAKHLVYKLQRLWNSRSLEVAAAIQLLVDS